MNKYIREPMNGFTHLAGAILAVVGLCLMLVKAASISAPALTIVAVIVFGISMILLYSASATYHIVVAREQTIQLLRRIDHSMIFVLIAGSYTPFCLIVMRGSSGWTLFGITTALATLGICFKLIWFNTLRWVSTGIYIGMGWLIVFFFAQLADNIAPSGLMLLIIGGLLYTIGGVLYGIKPTWAKSKYLGYHEIFHLFVLSGSLFHFLSVYLFILQ